MSYGGRRWRRKAAALALMLFAAPVAAEEVTVLAFGDSLTQGYGLPVEKGFVPVLESWLRERGEEVRIVNGGVSGETTEGGKGRIEWSLTPEIDAMILELGGNDILRGIEPAVTRANLDHILSAAQQRDIPVLVVGLQASRNFGEAYKAAFDAIHPELAQQYGALHEENFFAGLGGDPSDPAALRQWMQSDGIHPNADGVQRIVEHLGPRVQELIDRVE